MLGYVEVQNTSGLDFHDDEHIDQLERGRHDDEEVAGDDGFGMVADKRKRCEGSVGRLGFCGMWRRIVPGEIRMPIFSNSSSAMRSSPQGGITHSHFRDQLPQG